MASLTQNIIKKEMNSSCTSHLSKYQKDMKGNRILHCQTSEDASKYEFISTLYVINLQVTRKTVLTFSSSG